MLLLGATPVAKKDNTEPEILPLSVTHREEELARSLKYAVEIRIQTPYSTPPRKLQMLLYCWTYYGNIIINMENNI